MRGADAVPKSVLLRASNSSEEKLQANPGPTASTPKAVTVQSVVLGTIDPRIKNPVKAALPQQPAPDVWVAAPVTVKFSPGKIVPA
jgi:hypothetical protein